MQFIHTSRTLKDTIINSAARGRIIALLFHSFEVALGPHPKDLTFFQTNETELIQHVFGGSECPKDKKRAFKLKNPAVFPISE